MYRTLKRFGQSFHRCVDCPQRKHMICIVPTNLIGADALGWDRLETMAICGAYHEIGGAVFAVLTGALQNMLLANEGVSE
jgi:hypothetical protein